MKYTIFTPTYNRAHLLPKVYESLCTQASKDFEWLVIDDGSTDNTEEVIGAFKEDGKIVIRYIKQSNGGKHRAFNKAIEEADSDWFVCVDSDDPLVPDAISNMDKAIALISDNKDVAGIVGVCITPSGEPMGNVPGGILFSDTIESRDRYHLQCEPEVYRLSILKNYRFPEFEGEKFVTEAILFDKLTIKHKLLYTNFPMQIKEYLPGGLTDTMLRIRVNSPNGSLLYYKQRSILSNKINYKVKALINYYRFYLHAKANKKTLVNPFYKTSLLVAPLGLIMWVRDTYLK